MLVNLNVTMVPGSSNSFKMVIAGAGSIGSLFAWILAKNGLDVTVVAREPHSNAIMSHGLVLQDRDGVNQGALKNITCGTLPEVLKNCSVLMISVKVHDLEAILQEIEPAFITSQDPPVIVLLQNGLGNERMVERYYPGATVVRIVTSNGAMLASPGHVVHAGRGNTFIGISSKDPSPLASTFIEQFCTALYARDLHVQETSSIQEHVWKKVIINIGINAVGAIFQVPNGKILENQHLLHVSRELVKEATEVAHQQGYLSGRDGWGVTKRVMQTTAKNRNSMLQDLDKGKKTEIDFINGAISSIGRETGISTPWNDAMVELIHGFETIDHPRDQDHDTSGRTH
ncbi:2-dehydropantoate 2-reductase [Candidatus Bathyarchaeota archaeon]|nr:2-dehydropantoate 2-reductase [Candidatus Bathyarchaeota archaeon]